MTVVIATYSAERSAPSISRLIHYPDGVSRILTMKSYEWDWVALAEQNGFTLYTLLAGAVECARRFPSGQGFQRDVLEATRSLLLTVAGMVYEEAMPLVNDNV